MTAKPRSLSVVSRHPSRAGRAEKPPDTPNARRFNPGALVWGLTTLELIEGRVAHAET